MTATARMTITARAVILMERPHRLDTLRPDGHPGSLVGSPLIFKGTTIRLFSMSRYSRTAAALELCVLVSGGDNSTNRWASSSVLPRR